MQTACERLLEHLTEERERTNAKYLAEPDSREETIQLGRACGLSFAIGAIEVELGMEAARAERERE